MKYISSYIGALNKNVSYTNSRYDVRECVDVDVW